jgi:hypothetical protein
MLIRTMKLPPEETLSILRYFSGLTSHVTTQTHSFYIRILCTGMIEKTKINYPRSSRYDPP